MNKVAIDLKEQNLLLVFNLVAKKKYDLAFKLINEKTSTKYLRCRDLELSLGNFKLGINTLILNMNSAHECPSLNLGLCKIGKQCYAYRDENQYENALNFRRRQEQYWDGKNIDEIIKDFKDLLTLQKTFNAFGKLIPYAQSIKYLRFSEAGDFKTFDDIFKLNELSKYLKKEFNIITYGYSARKDLFQVINNKNIELDFVCHGSGHDQCKDGETTIMKNPNSIEIINGKTFLKCPMKCVGCFLCKIKGKNIVFKNHYVNSKKKNGH